MPFRTGGMRLVVMEMLVVMWVLALSKPAVIVQTLGEALTHASFTDIIAFAYLISHSLTDGEKLDLDMSISCITRQSLSHAS